MYKDEIIKLIQTSPLEIDTKMEVTGRLPTSANSEFLTNKEQGDWAEQIVLNAINEYSEDHFAVKYGRTDTISAGDPGFARFYREYRDELNNIGKKPDILIFRKSDFCKNEINIENDDDIQKSVAAIEVRSSSFLVDRYSTHMKKRQEDAIATCINVKQKILSEPYNRLLKEKNAEIYKIIASSNEDTFKNIDFRLPSWSINNELIELKNYLRKIKDSIKILHKRDYLSITPKLEDIALVNRWIQKYNVRHFYLQVFFDKAYIIPFRDILSIVSDYNKEETNFTIERDVKNQQKTTIKVNIEVGKEILGKIDMPKHKSNMKELDRGRLLFHVCFHGGKGYLDIKIFNEEVVNGY